MLIFDAGVRKFLGIKEEEEMYRERGVGGSKTTEVGPAVDRKRINDALDKQLERSSPSTSRAINGKDKPLIMGGKQPPSDHRDSRSAAASLAKTNCSDGLKFSLC